MKLFNIFTTKNNNDYVTNDESYIKHKQCQTMEFICHVWSVHEDEFYRVEEQFFKQYDGNLKVFEGQCRRYDEEKRVYTYKLCKKIHKFWFKNKENLLASKRFGRCERCKLSFLEQPRWNQKYCNRDWCDWENLLHSWYDHQCARCEEDLTLRIHHLDENPSDSSQRNHRKDFIEKCKRFVVLCPTCHEAYHSRKLLKKEIENYHQKLPDNKSDRLKRLSSYAQSKYNSDEPSMDWQKNLSSYEE